MCDLGFQLSSPPDINQHGLLKAKPLLAKAGAAGSRMMLRGCKQRNSKHRRSLLVGRGPPGNTPVATFGARRNNHAETDGVACAKRHRTYLTFAGSTPRESASA